MTANRVRGLTHSVDPRQLLAHVHDDDGDQLPAEGALGQQAENRQSSLVALRLRLQTHLCQLRLHVVPAAQPPERCRGADDTGFSHIPSLDQLCVCLSSPCFAVFSSPL